MSSLSQSHLNQKNKKVYDKYIPSLSAKQFQERKRKLTIRLSREQICRQHKLIANMNLKLQIRFQHLLKLEQLVNLKIEDAVKIVNNIQCLTWISQANLPSQSQEKNHTNQPNNKQQGKNQPNISLNSKEQACLHLKYPSAQKIILLTGITKVFTQNCVREFNTSYNHHGNTSSSYKKQPQQYHQQICEVVGVNQFWIAIEADTNTVAYAFKRFVRNKKKACDQKKLFSYRNQKKRVRIVMQNQDFYTLLVDAMTQKKNSQFFRRLVNPNSGVFPEICPRDPNRIQPFLDEQYQISLKKINKLLYFPFITHLPYFKQPSDQPFTLEQVYSQDLSKTSEYLQSLNNMNDLIEKADQGTQAQSLGSGKNQEQNNQSQNNGQNNNKIDEQKQNKQNNNKRPCPSQNREEQQMVKTDTRSECPKDLMGINTQDVYKNKAGKFQKQILQDVGSPADIQQNRQEQGTFVQDQAIQQTRARQDQQGVAVSNEAKAQQGQDKLSSELIRPTPLLSLVRQPEMPPKLLILCFQTHSQTQTSSISYTKMKRMQAQMKKKSSNRTKLQIPQQFRQISDEQKNRNLFYINKLKSMQRTCEKKQRMLDFY